MGLMPVRYVGTENSEDPKLRLARTTTWSEAAGGAYLGLGQRVLSTDAEELGLLEVREIEF